MKDLLASGRVVDIALAVMALELLVLLLLRRKTAGRLGPWDLVGQLLAGTMLLLALRCALTEADPRWTLAFLTASFPAHMFDVVRRLRTGGRAR